MSTFNLKAADVQKKWVLIDAEGLVVGRLAAIIARRLRGKHLRSTPARRLRRQRRRHQRRQGRADRPQADGQDLLLAHRLHRRIKERTARQILEGKFPERVLEKAVERMIPEGPLGRKQLKNLRVYSGSEHPHAAQNPEAIDIAALSRKNQRAA